MHVVKPSEDRISPPSTLAGRVLRSRNGSALIAPRDLPMASNSVGKCGREVDRLQKNGVWHSAARDKSAEVSFSLLGRVCGRDAVRGLNVWLSKADPFGKLKGQRFKGGNAIFGT